MAFTPTEVQSGNATNAASVSQLTISSITIPEGYGQLLVLGSSVRGVTAISSAYLGMFKLTNLQVNDSSGSECRAEFWYLKDPVPGTYDLVVNYASSCYCIFGYTLFKNVDLVTTFSNTTITDHDGTTASSSLTSQTGDLAICCASFWDNGYNDTPTYTDAYLYRRIWNTAASGSNRTWALSSGEDGAASVTFDWACVPTSGRWAFIKTSLLPMETIPPKKMRYYRRERIPDYISTLDAV